MKMTYRKLREELSKLNDNQLDMDVAIVIPDIGDIMPVQNVIYHKTDNPILNDELEEDQPFLVIDSLT